MAPPPFFRARLAVAGAMLLPLLALVFGWHARDALGRGESLWPVVLGGALVVGLLGGTGFFVLREGPGRAGARAARLMRWVAPIAAALAGLRLVAWLFGWG